MAELKGLWRFHTGDDPDGKLGWADSGFDDSSWKLLHSDQPWNQEGYPGYSGMAWYRFQVILPANHQPLALYIPIISTSYQVFAGGRLIGQFGGLPPREKVVLSLGVGTQTLIPLPIDLTSGGGPLTIAIRVWQWPRWSVGAWGGGPRNPVRFGDAGLLDEWKTLQIRSAFWDAFAANVLLFGYLLAGLAGLGLFLMRPGEREYLWFAAAELANAAILAFSDDYDFRPVSRQGHAAVDACLTVASNICFLMSLFALLKQRRTLIYWIALASVLVGALPGFAYSLDWIGDSAVFGTVALADLPYFVCVFLLLFFAARRGNLDARLLLGPVVLS